jgi:hypothetical protein
MAMLFAELGARKLAIKFELDICLEPEDMGQVISEFSFPHTFMASLVTRNIDLTISLYGSQSA